MLRKNSSLLIVLGTIIAIIATNGFMGKFLMGWDNLLPEFNLFANIQRSFFSVWQEHQGLGLLAGNAHATELIYQIYVFILSLILPTELIRQAFSFIMLFIGGIGAYFLTKYLLVDRNTGALNKIVPVLGSLFYIFNLSTIQTFYVPFEPFIIHFGFLPWLLISLFKFLKKPIKKNFIIFILINLLALPQAQVPTVFFVYGLIIGTLIFYLNITSRVKTLFLSSAKAILTVLIINAFWLLPFFYFTFTNSQVTFQAKINQMSTETVFLQNKEFGNVQDVMLLKGFWLNNVDPDVYGNYSYMMAPWRQHLASLPVLIIGYVLFAIILFGLIMGIKRRIPILTAFGFLLLFSFTMLVTNSPPFSWINYVLRSIPIFNQAFRFPFTKFSIVASLAFAVFFAIGAGDIIFRLKKLNAYFLSFIFILLLLIFTFPIFKGNLFYYKDKVSMPNEYLRLFDYFKNQDQNSRIANFPQYTFWGWNYYQWTQGSYGGSGFLWYGIRQPILDRAFDVWSKESENYYWEISNALYSKNPLLFKKVLNKYQIRFVLVDKNVINPSSSKALFIPELQNLLSKIPEAKKDADFGNIIVYKINLKDSLNSFIFTTNSLKKINSYDWGNLDKGYLNLGTYISENTDPDVIYPFRSIFSGKNPQSINAVINKNNEVEFSAKIPNLESNTSVNYDSGSSEDLVFVEFIGTKDKYGNFNINAQIKPPQINLINNGKENKLPQPILDKAIFTVPANSKYPLSLNAGGFSTFTINSNSIKKIGSTSLSLKQDNLLALTNNNDLNLSSIIATSELISNMTNKSKMSFSDVKNGKIKISFPLIVNPSESFSYSPTDSVNKIKNCDNFRKGKLNTEIITDDNQKWLKISSEDATNCISFYLPGLNHLYGYLLYIENKNISGRPLRFWLLNENEKISPIDVFLETKNNLSVLVLPPQSRDGLSYSLHFENISIGNQKTINYLGEIKMIPIPYNFLTSISFNKDDEQIIPKSYSVPKVTHPNESLYVVKEIPDQAKTLILSQSYNSGWKAYQVPKTGSLTAILPFFFGKELKNHVLINNWENGWVLPVSTQEPRSKNIVIAYLPQYLQYFGLVLLLIVPILIFVSRPKD
jgi:hypothetical protein